MKKLTVIFLVIAVLASLIACGNAKDKNENKETNDATTPIITTTEKPADAAADKQGDDTTATTTEQPGTDEPVPADSVAGEYEVDMFLVMGTLKLEESGKASMISSFGSAEDGALELIVIGTYTAEGNKASCVFTESAQRLVFADSSAKDEFLSEAKNQLDTGSITEEEYNQALELLSEEGVKIESEDQQFDELDVYVLDLANNAAYQCEVRNSEYVQKTEYDDNFNVIGTRYESGNGITETKYDSDGNKIYVLHEDEDGKLVYEYTYKYDSDGNTIYELFEDEDGKSETYYEYQDGNVVKEKYLFDGELVYEDTYEYDDHGNETKVTSVEDGETYVTENANEYDESGNLIKVTTTHDGEAFCETFYEYFDNGDKKSEKIVYEDGTYSFSEYDEDYNMILIEFKYDEEVHSIVYSYDEDGYCVYEKETVNGVVVFEGDPNDREDDWEDWED